MPRRRKTPTKRSRQPKLRCEPNPSHGWHETWVLAFLAASLVALNVYYNSEAMDVSLIPRLFGLLAVQLAAVLLLLVPYSARRMDFTVLKDPLVICYGAYTAVSFASLTLALNPATGFTDAFKTFGAWMVLCLVCLLLPTLPRWRERFLQVISMGAALSVAWGFYEMLSIWGIGLHDRSAMANVTATMANVNLYASFLILGIPFLLCAVAVLTGWWRVFTAIASVLAILMVVLLQTRAAYFGLAGSLVAAAVLAVIFGPALGIGRRGRVALGVLVLLLPLAVAAFFVWAPESNPLAARLRSISAGAEDTTLGARLMAWKITLQMIADHFPLGVGTGNFTVRLDEYFNAETDFRGETTNWIYPHNDYLWVLVEQGLAGFAAFLGIFIIAFWHALTALRRPTSPAAARLALAVIMVLVAYLLNSFFDFPLARVNHQIYLAAALAVAVLLARETRGVHHSPVSTPYSRWVPATAVPVILVLALGITYARAAIKQEYYLSVALELQREEMWEAALRVIRGASTWWKTTDPFASPWAYREAVILERLGRKQETLLALQRAYEQNPNRIHVINDLGIAYAEAGRFDEAIALFTKTVERYPHQIDCVENLALCHMDRNDYASALAVLEGIPEEKRTESIREKLERCRRELGQTGGEPASAGLETAP